MPTTPIDVVVDRYLEQLVEGGDFTDIPMRADLRFRGPLARAGDATTYRSICADFASAVANLTVRTRIGSGDVVHLVYDVDMGLPDGPLPTSQTIRFEEGAMADVEVIFDAARIPEVAA